MAGTIPIDCTCGATVQAPAQYAGRTYACQTCGQALKVPGPKATPPAGPKPSRLHDALFGPATLDDLLRELARIRRRLDVFLLVFVILPLVVLGWVVVRVLGSPSRPAP